jgi:hypothetical protein
MTDEEVERIARKMLELFLNTPLDSFGARGAALERTVEAERFRQKMADMVVPCTAYPVVDS